MHLGVRQRQDCKLEISSNSNKLTNQMQQFYEFITLTFCVAQHVWGASAPIIRSMQLH